MLIGSAIFPGGAFAQTTGTNASIQAQLDAIKRITQQILALQQQLQQLQQQRMQTTSDLLSTLSEGSKGDKVKTLQALLAADPEIYPEGLITGFYGSLTAKAVRQFQKKNGIAQVGFVGPKTLEKLNELLKKNPISLEDDEEEEEDDDDDDKSGKKLGIVMSDGKRLCAIVPPGHLIAPGWLKKQNGVRPIVPPCQILPPGIIPKLGGSTSTTSTVDITAPAITNVAATSGPFHATITWTTNEPTDSQVFYGISQNYGFSTAILTTPLISHSRTLTGLSASTTYHFQIRVKDAAGNVATSSDGTFTTLVAPDTTPPIISGISAQASSTTATISWLTNESSTSKVYYSLVTPLDITSTSTLSQSNSALVTNHSLGLTGLSASTTYYFAVESIDSSNNKATSGQQPFTTTP